MRLITLAAAVLATAATAACGGGSSASSSPSSEQRAADLKQAQAMVPRLSDFPSGWTQDFSKPSGGPKKCQVSKTGLVKTSEVGRDKPLTFTQGQTTEVLGRAATWESDAETSVAYRRSIDLTIIHCFASTFEQSVRAGADTSVTVDTATVSELELPTIGDASKAYQVKLPLESQGTTSTYYIDYVIFRVHRGLGAVLALSFKTPFDEHLLETITAKMAARGAGTTGSV